MKVDYLIVGAGLAGCVLAERIATQLGQKVLIVEKRNHIGGNCYDYYNEDGILVHKYGPHYFHTNNKKVFDYLSQFTKWHYVFYRIRVVVDGRLVPLPVNLDTINEIYGYRFSTEELKAFLQRIRVQRKEIKNSEDLVVSRLGYDLFNKIYRPYTLKQWGLEPKQLDASVCGRIDIRDNRDDRYFTDKYQAMPKAGYHRLFENMINHPNIFVLLQTKYEDIKDMIQYKKLIYTGPIDAFFEYKYGRLPYRSLRFEHETLDCEYYQPVVQLNYPNEYDFTRIIEIKHVTGQRCPKTTIVREYPQAEGEPYYPVPCAEARAIYEKYEKEAKKLKNVYFIGRLAEYKYLNMDQVVARALALFEKIAGFSD